MTNLIIGRRPCGCIAIVCHLPLPVKVVTAVLTAIELGDLEWGTATLDDAYERLGTCKDCDPSAHVSEDAK